MTDDEYAAALESERAERNARTKYMVREDDDAFQLVRRNGAGMGWGVNRYISRETADLAAAFLNRLKEDEA
ncbi:hypothetical protein ABZ352_35485 [Streptomyces griseofuscus]|uniref:hypothetical protein n=1 Tax=Streptomyces griseofuscus TaxID=146922 RepID=UPI0033C91BA3